MKSRVSEPKILYVIHIRFLFTCLCFFSLLAKHIDLLLQEWLNVYVQTKLASLLRDREIHKRGPHKFTQILFPHTYTHTLLALSSSSFVHYESFPKHPNNKVDKFTHHNNVSSYSGRLLAVGTLLLISFKETCQRTF